MKVFSILFAAVLGLVNGFLLPAQASDKFVVYTTFYPTQYFTQRIGGDLVEVVNPVPETADPNFWEPERKILEAFQNADMIVLNGAGYEKWIINATLPDDKIVDTAQPLSKELLIIPNAITHSHGGSGMHSHSGINPHTWVDPTYAKLQAGVIRDALIEQFPEQKDVLEQRYAALAADLGGLEKTFQGYAANYDGVPVFNSHPSYDYLARRYHWKMVSFHLDPTEMPSAEQFQEIKSNQQQYGAKYLIWEGAPRPEIARRFQDELGLQSLVFQPAEVLTATEQKAGADYLSIMKQNLANIKVIFQGAKK